MKQVNMHDAKTNLSRHIAELKPGDKIVICNRNESVAEIHPIGQKATKRRIGVAKGQIKLTPEFWDPLPEDMLKAFSSE